MAISVRAAGAACVALCVLSAAAPAPDIDGSPPLAPTTTNRTIVAALPQAPAFFVLGDRAPAPAAEPPSTDADIADAAGPAPERATEETAATGDDAHCLAVAVYYESRGEPLAGQMAVAHVILNRVHSGRFADSVCGVIRQPGQFSFVHRSFAPAANADWTKAVAVARAALAGEGASHAKGALFFHASYVAPGWGRSEVATIGHHVFYR